MSWGEFAIGAGVVIVVVVALVCYAACYVGGGADAHVKKGE